MFGWIRRVEDRIDADARDLVFRALFSTIFVALGAEHLVDDRLIQHLMPAWVHNPTLVSRASGVLLLLGGTSIAAGYKIQLGARLLGAFLLIVTLTVHLPGCFEIPSDLPPESAWLWVVLQRSNLVKNVCLFGVCVHLTTHAAGRFSADAWLARRRRSQGVTP